MATRIGEIAKITEALNGSPVYMESISATSGSSTTNATAFNGGEVLLIQPTANVYVIAGTSTVTVTSSNGVLVEANEKFYLTLTSTQTHVAARTGSGSATVAIFKMV